MVGSSEFEVSVTTFPALKLIFTGSACRCISVEKFLWYENGPESPNISAQNGGSSRLILIGSQVEIDPQFTSLFKLFWVQEASSNYPLELTKGFKSTKWEHSTGNDFGRSAVKSSSMKNQNHVSIGLWLIALPQEQVGKHTPNAPWNLVSYLSIGFRHRLGCEKKLTFRCTECLVEVNWCTALYKIRCDDSFTTRSVCKLDRMLRILSAKGKVRKAVNYAK